MLFLNRYDKLNHSISNWNQGIMTKVSSFQHKTRLLLCLAGRERAWVAKPLQAVLQKELGFTQLLPLLSLQHQPTTPKQPFVQFQWKKGISHHYNANFTRPIKTLLLKFHNTPVPTSLGQRLIKLEWDPTQVPKYVRLEKTIAKPNRK